MRLKELQVLKEPTENVLPDPGGEQDPTVAELTGPGARLVAKGARGSWSPDGKRIAVGKMPFGSGICVIQVGTPDGNSPRVPAASGTPVGAAREFLPYGKDPAWSPNGRWLAFTREATNEGRPTEEIWLAPVGETSEGEPIAVRLRTGAEEWKPIVRRLGTGVMATWSADAKTVFFSNPRTREILSIRVDKPDTAPVVVWKALGLQFPDLWYPVVAPDGQHVAYHADDRLKIADMATGRIVACRSLVGWRGWLGGRSPDGHRLGYGAFGGEEKGLWVMSFIDDGKTVLPQPRKILSGSCTLPSWSPDDSQVAFDFRSPSRGYGVWTVDVKRLRAASESTTSEGVGPTVRVFRRRHAKAQDVAQEIRRVLPRGGQFVVDSRMNAILVSGDAETLKIVEELIGKFDVAPPELAAAAKPLERGEGDPTQKYQRASISELEQAIAKLQRDLTLAEAKTRKAAAAMRQAEQAEKAASGEAKLPALFRKLKAEVAAQRERNAGARIKSEFRRHVKPTGKRSPRRARMALPRCPTTPLRQRNWIA
ncbi:MAG: secretin N-terminal domain-containing protein [Pirellulales bacterium]